ncbi:unnamed protein product [Sphagnum balticum]
MSEVAVKFEKQARGLVHGTSRISGGELAKAQKVLKSGDAPFIPMLTLIDDDSGNRIAEVKTTWQIKSWNKCAAGKVTPILYLSDDAPPTTLFHEFIHFYQMEQEKKWCELDGRVLESDEKKERALLYHRFEFEALRVLFEEEHKMSLNFEDKLLMLEGLKRENQTMTLLNLTSLDERTAQSVNRELEILHSQMNYITWLSRTPEDAGSVLEKMEVLNMKACVENSRNTDNLLKRVNDCVQARCALSSLPCRKLVLKDLVSPTHDPLLLTIMAWTANAPDLFETCSPTKLRDEFIDHLQEPTPCWRRVYLSRPSNHASLKLVELRPRALPTLFNAPTLNVDEKIIFQKAISPRSFIQKAYCYSVFQKAAGYTAIPIDQFAYATQGATISRKTLPSYRAWLEDKEGEACDKLVKMFTGSDAARFDNGTVNKKFLLIINPLAAIGGGLDTIKANLATDINHERLHIIFSENKPVQIAARDAWVRLSPAEKTKFKTRHPQYDYSEENTTLREFFAYSHQEHPDQGEQDL